MDGTQPTAILTSLTAQVLPAGGAAGEEISFTGPARFTEATVEHIRQVILPLVDQILAGLSLARPHFQVSVVNPGGASAFDLPLKISGYSADVPLFLALLSAALALPLPQDLVSTGHLASPAGDIRMVRDLPAKLAAAAEDPAIRRFVYPALSTDLSTHKLAPMETEAAQGALAQARERLRTLEAASLAQLLGAALEERDIVLASLERGFFIASLTASTPEGLRPVLRQLTQDLEGRFWDVLERQLAQGDAQAPRRLLKARSRHERERQHYPTGLGHNLWRRVIALPPARRELGGLFPLLAIRECIALSQHAQPQDEEDIPMLYDAALGRHLAAAPPALADMTTSEGEPENAALGRLEQILGLLTEEALAQKIAIPIDTARACYALPRNTAQAEQEFLEILGSYYLHLTRHAQFAIEAEDPVAAKAAAIALAERVFDREGGLKGALTLAKTGSRGGLRVALDRLTDYFKGLEREKYLNLVAKECYEALPYNERTALTSAFIQRLAPLAPGIVGTQPDQYVNHFPELLRLYIQARDTMSQAIRQTG